MIDFASTTISVVKKSLHLYYEEKDMNYLLSHCINDDIPLIGIVKPTWSNKLSVYSEHYQFYRQSETSFLVYGKITVRELSNNEEHCDKTRNITINCLLADNDIMFSSIHVSSASDDYISTDINAGEIKQFYHEAMEKCYDVFVEYDNINNSFYYNVDGFNALFETDVHFVNTDQMFWYMCTECVHPDDIEKMDVFRNVDIEKRIRNNDCKICFDVRIKNSVVNYKWVQITVLLFPNPVFRLNKMFFLVSDIDNRKRQELENLVNARKDSLTGIFNRRYTEALIKHCISENDGISAFILVDIDNFKMINDTFGHLSGDIVLKKITACISNTIGDFDIFGRFGGDELLVYIRNRKSIEEIKEIINNIFLRCRFVYEEDGNIADVHVSMGATIIRRADMLFDDVFASSDDAMYSVKKNNKDNYIIIDK